MVTGMSMRHKEFLSGFLISFIVLAVVAAIITFLIKESALIIAERKK
jgi:ABC-type multidrug transport system permease subunit